MAISACESFGVTMSIASMSLRSMSFRQSVSVDSKPQLSAYALSFVASRPHAALRTGTSGVSKNFAAL